MNADPNARPAVPGYRSATLNNHGDIAACDVVKVQTVFGTVAYLDREQLAGTRALLRQHRKDGTLKGRFGRRSWTPADPLHRENIDPSTLPA